MKNQILKSLGVLALLSSTASLAATVNAVPSNATPNVSDAFTVTVSAVAMPANVGPSLGLSFDTTKVSFVSAVPAATGAFSTGGGGFLTVVNPGGTYPIELYATPAGSPAGDFDVFVLNFTAVGNGAAAITLIENTPTLGINATFAWFDASTFNPIEGIVYNQADVCVGGGCNVIPVPAAAWLIAPAVLAAGRFSRRRKAA